MNTYIHLAFTSLLALMLYPLFGPWVLIIFLGGWLIDFDHYVWWVATRKRLNIREFFHFYNVESPKSNHHVNDGNIFLGHTIEFFLLALILAFLHPIGLIFFIGLLEHWILDAIWLATVPKRLILNHSLLSWLWMHKIKR